MQFVEQVLDSREVAEMIGKKHKDLIRDIKRYAEQITEGNLHFSERSDDSKTDTPSTERKIAPSDFFTESSYKDSTGRTLPCYMVTKKGCEFIAHKLTGVKGTMFTARYINRFHEMEEQLLKENHMDWFVNDVRVFQHREFGILRTLKLDEQDYFVGIDATRSLGYVNNTDTLKKRVSDSEKCYVGICDGNRCRKMVAITRKGLDELIRTGRLPLANKYSEWIQKQVFPALSGSEVVPVPCKEEVVPVYERVEPIRTCTPAKGMVVNIPENKEAQEAIMMVRKYLTGMDALLDIYNMYNGEEDYKKVCDVLREMQSKISWATSRLSNVRPKVIEKYL